MSKVRHTVKFDRVEFERMVNGEILVTIYWPGSEAMLSRSVKIRDYHLQPKHDGFSELRELIEQAEATDD